MTRLLHPLMGDFHIQDVTKGITGCLSDSTEHPDQISFSFNCTVVMGF